MTRSIWNLIAMALISIAASGQTNPVYQSPAAGVHQKIVQSPNTIFSSNNLDGIVYLDACANSSCALPNPPSSYNWSQTSTGSITVGQNVVTLNSCPAGILAPPSGGVFQPSTEFWLTGGGGNPEAVLVTSTTCPLQGSASGGNISFVAAYVHIGYTIGSASSGIQEAINAGNFITTNNLTGAYSPQNGAVVIPSSWASRAASGPRCGSAWVSPLRSSRWC